jgi:hypothetical protein
VTKVRGVGRWRRRRRLVLNVNATVTEAGIKIRDSRNQKGFQAFFGSYHSRPYQRGPIEARAASDSPDPEPDLAFF